MAFFLHIQLINITSDFNPLFPPPKKKKKKKRNTQTFAEGLESTFSLTLRNALKLTKQVDFLQKCSYVGRVEDKFSELQVPYFFSFWIRRKILSNFHYILWSH